MIFFRFIKACDKYKFTFALSTYNGLTLILRPNNTFENIEIKERYHNFYSFQKMFLKAIKEMRKYRKK